MLNKASYDKERWKTRLSLGSAGILDKLVRIVTLEELYPGFPVEVRDEFGLHFEEKTEILPHQYAFHALKTPSGIEPKFILMSGGVGSGKSTSASVEIVKLLYDYPGIEIVCVTGYDYYFDESVYPTFEKVLPFDDPFVVKYERKFRAITCANGSTLRFKAYDDASKIRGWHCHVVWIEEASTLGDGMNEKAKPIFDALIMRMRGTGNIPLRMYITQNPRGYDWVWKVFIQKGKYGNEGVVREQPDGKGGISKYKEFEYIDDSGQCYYTVLCNTQSNKFLRAGYLDSLKESLKDDPQMYARMLDGEFAPINSLVYDLPYYSPMVNVIRWEQFANTWGLDPQVKQVPRDWRVFVGIDPGGARSPWAIEKYVETPNKQLVCIEEWYQKEQTWDQAIKACLDMMEGHDNVTFAIDPIAAPSKIGPNLQSVEHEFTSAGVNVKKPLAYNKTAGILHLRSMMRPDKQIPSLYHNDFLTEDGNYAIGSSTLYYIEGACPSNLAEKGVWRFDAKATRQPKESEYGLTPVVNEKPVDRDDHAQTAEIFAALLWRPESYMKLKRQAYEPGDPVQRYVARRRV